MDLVASAFYSSFIPYASFNLTSFAVQSIMSPLTSLLVLGSLTIQAVFSLPDPSRVKEREAEILKRSVDSFIATESPIALTVCALAPFQFPIRPFALFRRSNTPRVLVGSKSKARNTDFKMSRICCVTLDLQELVLREQTQGLSWLRQTRPIRTVGTLSHHRRPP
jgi:hypothetical protein